MMMYPEELDSDDIDELASYIERRYPTEEIRIHDTETIHFAYWDKSHRVVSATLLDHIQAAGYRVLHTGVATIPEARPNARGWSVANTNREKTRRQTKQSETTSPSRVITASRSIRRTMPEPLRFSARMMSGIPVIAAGTGPMGRHRSIARSSEIGLNQLLSVSRINSIAFH
jgi:hypothetical protein